MFRRLNFSLLIGLFISHSFHLSGKDEFASYQYIRGFLYGKKLKMIPSHYNRVYENFYADKYQRVSISDDENVILFGFCVHCENWKLNCKEIVALLSEKLQKAEKEFFQAEEKICGTYVIFYRNKNGDWRAFTDSGGLKKIFASKNKAVIGSHAKLVKEAVVGKKVSTLRLGGEPGTSVTIAAYGSKYHAEKEHFPGIYTPYKGVLLVPINHYVRSEDIEVRRFFPNRKYVPLKLKEAIPLFEDALAKILKGLFHNVNKRVLVTCTAGSDSRFTLNTLIGISNNFELISWQDSASGVDGDCSACIAIAKNLNLKCHHIKPKKGVKFGKTKEYIGLSEKINENNYYNFSKYGNHIQYLLNQEFKVDECVGIHSNIMELGKGWVTREMYKNSSEAFPQNTIYAKTHKLNSSTLLGYPTDKLFYLEQQIGAFRGHHIQHMEASYEFFNPYVCRYVFDLYHRTPHFVWGKYQRSVIQKNENLKKKIKLVN